MVARSASLNGWFTLIGARVGDNFEMNGDHVIGGPGAFVLVAKDFNSFGSLLIKKLIAEIALMGPRDELVPR